jgi:transposase
MRGTDERSGELFSYVDLEDRVPTEHPLRLIRRIVNEVLVALDGEFTKLYADSGRPSIAPERLLRALLLQVFYTIRSERQLMEQLHYNLLYRWFVGLGVDEPVWVPTVFTKNRERLLKAEVAHKFLAELLNHKEVRGLLSDEHFSVDGTQVAAWASMKSFRAKDGSDEPPSGGRNGERDFHGETRSNDTHASTTDPEARLYRKGKGKEAKLSYVGNALTENRHGLVVEAELGTATGTIEREAAMTMVVRHSPGSRRLTLGADKAYDVHGFVDDLRDLTVGHHGRWPAAQACGFVSAVSKIGTSVGRHADNAILNIIHTFNLARQLCRRTARQRYSHAHLFRGGGSVRYSRMSAAKIAQTDG